MAALLLAVLVGCSAPYDDDGEAVPLGPPPAASAEQIPVVVDTDLGADDLAAIAFLMRHPSVQVSAFTIAATGLLGCEEGVDVLAGLLEALEEAPLPVACGSSTRGPSGLEFPAEWSEGAARGSGITPSSGSLVEESAASLIASAARSTDGLVVVALGPLTNLADVPPADYRQVDRVLAMGGSVDGPVLDGVAEWNAAADPSAFGVVLERPVPLTIVPEDAVPDGTPDALDGAVLGRIARAGALPRWWDLATAAVLVEPSAGELSTGTWELDESEPGRLTRVGDGSVQVYVELDPDALDEVYAAAF